MPRKIKCSVDSCQNWRRDDILHKFPVRAKRLDLWLKSLTGVSDISNIRPGISVICNKHFERRFVTPKFNLQCGAYPTLFTIDEITSGRPAEVKTPVKNNIHLHLFPHPKKDNSRYNIWVNNVGSNLASLDPVHVYRNRRICHVHFEEKYLTWSSRLSRTAVPTLHIPGFQAGVDDDGVISTTASVSTMTVPVYSDVEGNDNIQPKPDPIKQADETATAADYVSSDHTYIRQKHEDHNYSKTPFSSTNESPAEKILSEHEDQMGTSKKNQPFTGQDRPATDAAYGSKSSIDLGSNNTRGEPNNIEDGIDLNSLDGFDEPPTEAIFSWQKEDILYPAEDTDVLMALEPVRGDKLRQLLEDVSLYDDKPTEPSQTHEITQKHADAEYQCNVCEKEIIGFHYTCVQCADFDLCGACEANGAHNSHYVLRVPKDRPYNEIQTVLAAIRQQLLAENLFLTDQIIEDSVKSEPEEDPVETPEGGPEEGRVPAPEPAAERDPLRRPTPDLAAEVPSLTIRSDDEYSEGSVYRPPRRKRRRRRSSITNSDTDSDSDSSGTTHTETPLHHKTRTKPATRSALSHPVHGNQLVTDCQPDVMEISGAIYQLPDDIFAVPGTVFKIPGNIYEVPASMAADCVLEVPDNITVFRQEPSQVITDRIFVDEDLVQYNLEENDKILHLRVPPDTDDAALAQALHSQAYVAMQPLVIRTKKR